MNRREFGRLAAASAVMIVAAGRTSAADWQGTLAAARGQTVYFHAWGGDPKINDFIAWVGALAQERHGVTLTHVKLAATSDAVARVVAEQAAGQTSGGAVDLIWINGENFAAMKSQGLLFGPFADGLPNFALVDELHATRKSFLVALGVDGVGLRAKPIAVAARGEPTRADLAPVVHRP